MGLKRFEFQIDEKDLKYLEKFSEMECRSSRKQVQYLVEEWIKRYKISKGKDIVLYIGEVETSAKSAGKELGEGTE